MTHPLSPDVPTGPKALPDYVTDPLRLFGNAMYGYGAVEVHHDEVAKALTALRSAIRRYGDERAAEWHAKYEALCRLAGDCE